MYVGRGMIVKSGKSDIFLSDTGDVAMDRH